MYFSGKIKEMIQAELGIPVDKQQLKGLVKRHVDDSVCLQFALMCWQLEIICLVYE